MFRDALEYEQYGLASIRVVRESMFTMPTSSTMVDRDASIHDLHDEDLRNDYIVCEYPPYFI